MENARWLVGYGVLVAGLIAVGIEQFGGGQPGSAFALQPASEPSATSAEQPSAPNAEAASTDPAATNANAAGGEGPTSAPAAQEGTSTPIGQDAEGMFRGKITALDSAGNAIPASNVLVTVTQDGLIIAEARTNANGEFQVPGLLPGEYTISARGPAGTASRTVQIAPFNQPAPNQPLDAFSMQLTQPAVQSGVPGGAVPLVAPRTSSAGGTAGGGGTTSSGGSSGGGTSSPAGGGDPVGSLGTAAGLAGLGGALSGTGSGSGGGSGGGSGSSTQSPNVSDFEP